jgi:hypothetical protein
MRHIRRFAVLTLWILSLVAASRWGTTEAQSTPERGQRGEQILTGNDIGFMVLPNTANQTRPAGVLVIRQEGKWVIPEIARQASPPSSRIVPLR